MFNNKQIFILSVLILLVASLSFNIGITGEAVKDVKTVISIEPKRINAGDAIIINVNPGERGVNKYVTFYRVSEGGKSSLRKAVSIKVCVIDYRCYKPISLNYPTSTNWPAGTYYAQVYDYASLEYVKDYFVVDELRFNTQNKQY